MNAAEFREWLQALRECPNGDDDETSAETDLAWRAMNALVEQIGEKDCTMVLAAQELGHGIAWAAFWLALGAVAVASILKTGTIL